jgi:RecA/RadA recombinase
LNKLLDKILKNSPTKYTSTLSTSTFFNDKDTVPIEVPIFNIAFSADITGGLSSGLTLLAGPPATYKSLASLLCIKAYLSKYKDGVCILYDSEGGITPNYLKSRGIDIERVIHIPINHIEMLKFDIVKQLEEFERGDKVIIVIDSIGNLASLKELEDALEEKSKAEMQRAKSIKGLFRMITPSLVNKDIICIAICHTYDEMSLYPRTIISGGTGLIYSANQAFIITKAQEKEKGENDLLGWNFTLNVEKSRFVKQKSKFTFKVLYDSGIYKWSGLLDNAIEAGLIIQSGAWFQLVDLDTGEIVEKKIRSKDVPDEYYEGLIQNDKFKSFIRKKYSLGNTTPETLENLEEDIL